MEQRFMNYIGPSMNPLLRDGDGLQIVPYHSRAVRPGDVIVFVPPGSEMKIVHRVVSRDARGIRTRGDNAAKVDAWVLTPHTILGRVAFIQRKNRRRKIIGGLVGRLIACSYRCMRRSDAAISFVLRPLYHRLARSTYLRKRVQGLLKPKLLFFKRPEGMELQVVVRRWLIGRRLPGRELWEIRRPFRICVDEAAEQIQDMMKDLHCKDEKRADSS